MNITITSKTNEQIKEIINNVITDKLRYPYDVFQGIMRDGNLCPETAPDDDWGMMRAELEYLVRTKNISYAEANKIFWEEVNEVSNFTDSLENKEISFDNKEFTDLLGNGAFNDNRYAFFESIGAKYLIIVPSIKFVFLPNGLSENTLESIAELYRDNYEFSTLDDYFKIWKEIKEENANNTEHKF